MRGRVDSEPEAGDSKQGEKKNSLLARRGWQHRLGYKTCRTGVLSRRLDNSNILLDVLFFSVILLAVGQGLLKWLRFSRVPLKANCPAYRFIRDRIL